MMSNATEEDILVFRVEYMLQIYSSLVLFLGIPANCICGVVMGTDKTNHLSTRFLMAMLAIVDTLVLLTALLRYWMKQTFNIDFRDYNISSCLIHSFVVAMSTDAAIATLCAIAIERFIVVAFPLKPHNFVNLKNTVISMVCVYVVLAMKNSLNFWFREFAVAVPFNTTNDVSSIIRNASIISPKTPKCTVKPHLREYVMVFSKVDFISYCIIPYLILFPTNIYIFIVLRRQSRILKSHFKKTPNKNDTHPQNRHYDTRSDKTNASHNCQVRRRQNRSKQPENIIKLITALTMVHFVTTLPGTVYNMLAQFFKHYMKSLSKSNRHLISMALMNLMFTNNAINFLAYFISSESFRKRLLKLIPFYTNSDTRKQNKAPKSCFETAALVGVCDADGERKGGDMGRLDITKLDGNGNDTLLTNANRI